MLPSSQRLYTKQFNEVLEKGRVVHSTLFILRTLSAKDKSQSRFGAVVSRKVGKTAVARHRLRRQMYEGIRKFYSGLRDLRLWAIVFAKAPAADAEAAAITEGVKEIFEKAGILK